MLNVDHLEFDPLAVDTHRMAHHHRRVSRPTSALICALAGGTIGLVAGAFLIDWIDPGPPDLSMEMLISMCVAGGLGWIAGAAFGWIGRVRDWPTPFGSTRWLLLAIAAAFTWFGIVAIHQAQHGSFGPMVDDISLRDPLRDRLALSIAADTVLVVGTLLTLAAYVPARSRSGEASRRRLGDHVENS